MVPLKAPKRKGSNRQFDAAVAADGIMDLILQQGQTGAMHTTKLSQNQTTNCDLVGKFNSGSKGLDLRAVDKHREKNS